jgi:hypothetical protein
MDEINNNNNNINIMTFNLESSPHIKSMAAWDKLRVKLCARFEAKCLKFICARVISFRILPRKQNLCIGLTLEHGWENIWDTGHSR